MPPCPAALQALLMQTLLVTSNVIVTLRIEVRPKPIHLGNGLIAAHSGNIKHSDNNETSQSGNPCALFHLVRPPSILSHAPLERSAHLLSHGGRCKCRHDGCLKWPIKERILWRD